MVLLPPFTLLSFESVTHINTFTFSNTYFGSPFFTLTPSFSLSFASVSFYFLSLFLSLHFIRLPFSSTFAICPASYLSLSIIYSYYLIFFLFLSIYLYISHFISSLSFSVFIQSSCLSLNFLSIAPYI